MHLDVCDVNTAIDPLKISRLITRDTTENSVSKCENVPRDVDRAFYASSNSDQANVGMEIHIVRETDDSSSKRSFCASLVANFSVFAITPLDILVTRAMPSLMGR